MARLSFRSAQHGDARVIESDLQHNRASYPQVVEQDCTALVYRTLLGSMWKRAYNRIIKLTAQRPRNLRSMNPMTVMTKASQVYPFTNVACSLLWRPDRRSWKVVNRRLDKNDTPNTVLTVYSTNCRLVRSNTLNKSTSSALFSCLLSLCLKVASKCTHYLSLILSWPYINYKCQTFWLFSTQSMTTPSIQSISLV